MNLCIIICTKNRSDDLTITLNTIKNQTELPDLVIIVDDGNCFFEYHLLPTEAYHPLPKSKGLTQARNYGISKVPEGTDIVLFLDDDVILDKDYISNLKSAFKENTRAAGISGFIRSVYYVRPWYVKIVLGLLGYIIPWKCPASFFKPMVRNGVALYPVFEPHGIVPAEWLSGCNMAYNKNLFDFGYRFDESMTGYCLGEDVRFSQYLIDTGHTLLLTPHAKLYHSQRGFNKCLE